MEPLISVIICTHNPRSNYLQRTLTAIRGQTLAYDQWELLLVDNASDQPLAESLDLSWHPHGRTIRENALGLTPARLRGIKDSKGQIICFVDDDNLLAPDYLANTLQIAADYSFIGAWGGNCTPEFETQPPEWLAPYMGNLALRKVEHPSWSNQYFDYSCTPIGAGMCLRRRTAEHYLKTLRESTLRNLLDRRGNQLSSCGDHDMAYCACDLKMGIGVFPTLQLTHIIPAARLEKNYLLKLLEADAYSSTILRKLRGYQVNPPPNPVKFARFKKLTKAIKDFIKPPGPAFDDEVRDARLRGRRKATNELMATGLLH